MPQECVFCKIGRGEVKSEILYSDDRCFAIKDINPKAPVHVLVIPYQHFTYLTYLTAPAEPMVGHLFMVAEEVAKRQGVGHTGYRLIVNQGANSGQEVPHLHLHLLGGKQLPAMG
jgi:histidine triad (HIT) family protein